MNYQLHNFAVRPTLIRDAVEAWGPWIESQIGCRLSDAVILEIKHNVAQIAVETVLGVEQSRAGASRITRRLKTFLVGAQIPSALPPVLGYSKRPTQLRFDAVFGSDPKPVRSRVEWQDVPVCLSLRSIPDPIVALNLFYQPGPDANAETEARLLIVSRRSLEHVIRLLELLDARDTTPTLTPLRSEPRKIIPCDWEDLVLNESVRSLLQKDFESFWGREAFFRERHLPFRRGYLLHGPPGNGKSTAIRAMMTSRGLSAFTMSLFVPHVTDADLQELFEDALSQRPALVIFEDLDRAFPRTGESKCPISLQSLLNALDGVATGEGLVVVATANEPAALDPAILRRPGRFDRVVRFGNPHRSLREQFFLKMNLSLDYQALGDAVANSKGFSFAQLREAVVLSAQFADERNNEIEGADLLRALDVLRETMVHSSAHSNRAGFTPEASEDEEAA
ncbi:AAA family ATPase [Occallatibacter savannae]|uniref:AAA family ATPase n=1 Tax=Occallatibacter savannae TaxID=1002691 RepID=UPI000D6965F7|nr:AAA family ATPase [Occallatibacter savannae]